jgi:hypothetical protein
MTRDSLAWPLALTAALLTYISTNVEELQRAFAGELRAIINIASGVVAVVSGYLYKSPLRLSAAGKRHYAVKQAVQDVETLAKAENVVERAERNAVNPPGPKPIPGVMLAAVGLSLCATLACSTGLKPKVVAAYQATEIGLGALQDTERALYVAGTVGELTKELHETKISPAFVKAFDAQIKFGNALLVWEPGATLPAGYDAWVSSVENTVQALSELLPRNRVLFDETMRWVRNAIAIIRALEQTVPPQLSTLVKEP